MVVELAWKDMQCTVTVNLFIKKKTPQDTPKLPTRNQIRLVLRSQKQQLKISIQQHAAKLWRGGHGHRP